MPKIVFKSFIIIIILLISISIIPATLADDNASVVYGSVSGHVIDKNGNTIPNAQVTMQDSDYKTVNTTTSDSGGAYTFNYVPGGHAYRFIVSLVINGTQYNDNTKFFGVNGLQSTKQDVQIIRYPPSNMGWLTGIVSTSEYYAIPVPATIYLNNGMYAFFTEDPGSQWQFYLPVGDYVVWAEYNNNNQTYSSAKQSIHINSDENSSEVLYIPLTTTPNATYHPAPAPGVNKVHGYIQQKNGVPLSGALVGLYRISQNGNLTNVMQTTTGQNGYYEFNNVFEPSISGNYVVKVDYTLSGTNYGKQSDAFTIYYPNTVNVTHDFPMSLTVDFVDTSSLQLLSNPEGAQIFIDGNNTGMVTPYNFTGIQAGSHDVSLQLSSYSPENFTVQIMPENGTSVTKNLKQSIGSVNLAVTPADSVVYVNGEYVGIGSLNWTNKLYGTYTYTVSRDVYRNDTGTFQVIPGQTMNYSVNLVAIPGLNLTYISYLINSIFKTISNIF